MGSFAANQKHGKGTCTGANGSVYVGTWERDKMHGTGKFTGADGSVYNGEWVKNERHGQGSQVGGGFVRRGRPRLSQVTTP